MVRLRSPLVLTTHGKWVQEFYEIPFELFYIYDLEIYFPGLFKIQGN